MSRLTIVEGNTNDKDNVRAIMVKGEKGDKGDNGEISYEDVVDNLTSTETQKPLSAKQGKVLKGLIDDTNEMLEPLLPLKAENIKVHYINLGINKGDCIVIETNNKNMIIDFGESTDGSPVINYLVNNNITKIDYALVTHYHADHIGGSSGIGLTSIINSTNIDFSNCIFLLPRELDTSKWHGTTATGYNNNRTSIITSLTNKGISYREPVEDEIIELDVNANVRLINCYNETNWDIYYDTTFHANGGTDDGVTELNNFSVVAELKHGKNIFLFTADVEPVAQEIIANKIYTCDVYKIEHHGANDTTNDIYLEKITPKVAINMNRENSNYNNRTLQYLRGINIPIYTTNESGNIFVVSDKYNIYPYSEENPYYESFRLDKFCEGNKIIGYKNIYTPDTNLLKLNDDLDDYITPGTYRCQNNTINNTILNKPIDMGNGVGGFILDVRQLSNLNIIEQTIYATNDYAWVFHRIKRITADDGQGNIETEWTTWQPLTPSSSCLYSEIITSGEDLNDYKKPGIYRSETSAITNSLSNCPLTNTGFKLEVEYLTNTNLVRQTIKVHNQTSDTYVRTRWGNSSIGYTWQSWYKVNTTVVS